MRRPELLSVLADRLRLISVSRRQVFEATDRVREVSWRRLPLYTAATIEGELLQTHLAVHTGLDLDGFVEVYEEFVAGYMLGSELHRWSPLSWLRSKLGLTDADAAQLFSDGRSVRGRKSANGKAVLQHLIALAALADYTFGATSRASTPTGFIVSLDRFRFGVDAGRPVTNLGTKRARTPRVAQLFCKRGLEHYGRDVFVDRENSEASTYSQLHAFALAQPELFGQDQEGFILGLNLARWRGRGRDPRTLTDAVIQGRDLAAFRQALRLAGGFEQFNDPYRDLKLLMVPMFVSSAEFTRIFGSAPTGRLTPERAQEWRMALDNLVESIKEE